jgi:spore germination protein
MLGKKPVVMLIITMLLLGSMVWPLTAASNPGIRIEGELRQFTPGALLIQGRTMVPVRFVVEDPALKGAVYWDGALRKVAMDCQDKYIEFVIGSKTARVDGVAKNLDVTPFIYRERSYIPLRFLAETLGATVSWDSVSGEVDISFSYKPEVFAYYYYTPWDEYAQNIDLFTDVALRWFKTDKQGNLSYDYQDQYEKVLQYARLHNVRAHLGVALMDKEALHTLLSNAGYRQNLIKQLHAQVKKDRYDGVNIDFEFIPPADADAFTQFLHELKNTLGADKIVSVAVFARTGQEKWSVAYQYKAIGQIVDRVVVMAYDYCYPDSAAGPVAPLWWVRDVGTYMIANIPREKILLGLPTYGYDWGSTGRAVTVTRPKLAIIQNKYRVTAGFDWKSMSPYYLYTDENGRQHTIWLENESSLAAKWNLATTNRLGGIAFWRIGNGFDDLYKILRQ